MVSLAGLGRCEAVVAAADNCGIEKRDDPAAPGERGPGSHGGGWKGEENVREEEAGRGRSRSRGAMGGENESKGSRERRDGGWRTDGQRKCSNTVR